MNAPGLDYDLKVASTYDADREGELHWIKEREYIEGYFRGKVVENILDIPVGTGRFISIYPVGAKVIGIDVSTHMLDQALREVNRIKRDNVELKVGNAADISGIGDHSVDVVVCCRLMHLVEACDRINFLREFSRVVKKEIILQVYLDLPKASIFARLSSRISRLLRKFQLNSNARSTAIMPWSHIKSYGFSAAELNNLLSSVGLRVVESTRLCSYGMTDVMIYILQNKNQ